MASLKNAKKFTPFLEPGEDLRFTGRAFSESTGVMPEDIANRGVGETMGGGRDAP